MSDSQQPVLIEQTRKRHKAWMLAGALIAIAGVIPFLLLARSDFHSGLVILMIMVAVGLCVSLVGRIGAWWNHG